MRSLLWAMFGRLYQVFRRPRCSLWGLATAIVWGMAYGSFSMAAEAATPHVATPDATKKTRELFVPFEDLHVLLENQPRRVLLPREQYDDLLKRAKRTPKEDVPFTAAVIAGNYQIDVEEGRARIAGQLIVEVLDDGLHAVPLDLTRVGLQSATLDEQPAAIGRQSNGKLLLFVEGRGRHSLALQMVAPLQTTAAWQVLSIRLPSAPSGSLRMTVPGDVELKSGTEVISREVDSQAKVTRFQLVPRPGDMTLTLSLNSHLAQQQRVVMASTVLFDEVTEAYEKLHATISLRVLRRAVKDFRLSVPADFEVTKVDCPLLSQWNVDKQAGRKVLSVQLREETIEPVLLHIAATRTPGRLDDWSFPAIRPLDVVSEVSILGLLLEQRLQAENIAAESLVPIDTAELQPVLPSTIRNNEADGPPLKSVVAYYAPQGDFSLQARFTKPAASMAVKSNLLWIIDEQGHELRGGLALLPQYEKRFAFDLTVPDGWHMQEVAGSDGSRLQFERHGQKTDQGRIRVRVPHGIAVGQDFHVNFHAVRTPPDWLGSWTTQAVELPQFAVLGAEPDTGAVAIETRDDLSIRSDELKGLAPLDEGEKSAWRLEGVPAQLAYRYDARPLEGTFTVRRTPARITARTFSFLSILPEGLAAHYELTYEVTEARTRQLVVELPKQTPSTLAIRGLDGVALKEYGSTEVGDQRRWTVLLAEAQQGTVRLALDFQQPLPSNEPKGFELPIVRAGEVAYQSGMVAVEGHAELDVQVKTTARSADVGELAGADYQPGRRLLGVYDFVGDSPTVTVDVFRRPGYPLRAAIVRQATLNTYLSPEGVAQTQADFVLRTKALFIEAQLPAHSTLWSVVLDGSPVKPQKENGRLLVSLPGTAATVDRHLRLVYANDIRRVNLSTHLQIPAPRLLLRDEQETAPVNVPLAELTWKLHLPEGYEITKTGGTLTTDDIVRPQPAALDVAAVLYAMAGGVNPFHGCVRAAREAASLSVDKSYRYSREMPAGIALEDETMDLELEEATVGMQPLEKYGAVARSGDAPPAEEMPAATPAPPADDPFGESEDRLKDAVPKPPEPAPSPAQTAEEKLAESDKEIAAGERGERAVVTRGGGAKRAQVRFDLLGVRSLVIDLADVNAMGQTVSFQSLGVAPELEVTVAERTRLGMFAWGLFLAVLLYGVSLTNRPVGRKIRYLVILVLVATLVPLVVDGVAAVRTFNIVFYAASLLVPYYLIAGTVKWLVRACSNTMAKPANVASKAAPATVALLLVLIFSATATAADAQKTGQPQRGQLPFGIQILEPPTPVTVPQDAIIIPYDPSSETGIRDARQIMVPYARYVELWNRAYPDKKIDDRPAPAPYALAGAVYRTVLAEGDDLLVEGILVIDVFEEGHVEVPLRLQGGVYVRATLDGRPARISVARPVLPDGRQGVNAPAQPMAQQAMPQQANMQQAGPAVPLAVLQVSGKGRHQLEVGIRLRLSRQGGWRTLDGVLPTAPATALTITVPEAETEVRVSAVADRSEHETTKANETIETALRADGRLSLRWRAKVAAGEVDRSLTAQSTAVLDVREDALRMVWRLDLEFRRSQREQFQFRLPEGYLVEKVIGDNIRGWKVETANGASTLDVNLLAAAKDREQIVVEMRRTLDEENQAGHGEFAVPAVDVPAANLHSGTITIRRSPVLEVRMLDQRGVQRTDIPADAETLAGGSEDADNPRPIQLFQAYRFATTPFTLRLAAVPIAARVTANVQTLLNVAQHECSLASRVILSVRDRAIYGAEVFLPEDIKLNRVVAPGEYQWAETTVNGRRLLTVYLGQGHLGQVSVSVEGTLPAPEKASVLLPRVDVQNVEHQRGHIAVIVDPGQDVRATKLRNCESVLVKPLHQWLSAELRPQTRLALQYSGGDYAGRLTLSARKALVNCTTISNVRITNRTVEETVLLNFHVARAGIREVVFQIPRWMADARIAVPMLRQKTIEPVDDDPDAPLRVRLELQDDRMGELRVLVENDRLLKAETTYEVPIPVVETSQTTRRFLTLETAARDEVVFDMPAGLDALSRQQKQWQTLASILGQAVSQAYLVQPGMAAPRLAYHTQPRQVVQTAGASIGLAETDLIADANGAYRGRVVFRVDNKTEQFLELQLPEGATLWTVRVAGEAVKPTEVPDASNDRLVRIPLIKTAAGDLDYEVSAIYAGKLPALGSVASVQFPFVRTRNINVARSQVRLHVPKTYRWVRFTGTMGEPKQEGDLAAGYVAYQTNLTQRLLDTLRHGGKFSKVRAAANLESLSQKLGADVDDYRQQADISSNEEFTEALEANQRVLQQAVDASHEVTVQSQGETSYNRDRLNDYFEGQQAQRASNVAKDLGRNWGDQGTAPEAPRKAPTGFNKKWLDKNQLTQPVEKGKPEGSDEASPQDSRSDISGVAPRFEETARKKATKGRQMFGSGIKSDSQLDAPEIAQGKAKSELSQSYEQREAQRQDRRRSGRDREAEALQKYQQRLQTETDARPKNGSSREMPSRRPLPSISGTESGGIVGFGASGAQRAPASQTEAAPGAVMTQPTNGPAGQPAAPALPQTPASGRPMDADTSELAAGDVAGGLASLELPLPEADPDFYEVFRFTTARGEVELVAQGTSRKMLDKLGQLGVILLVVVVVLAVVQLARHGGLSWLKSRSGSTTLVVLGLLALLIGVLPIAGSVALIVGLALKLPRRQTSEKEIVTAEVVS